MICFIVVLIGFSLSVCIGCFFLKKKKNYSIQFALCWILYEVIFFFLVSQGNECKHFVDYIWDMGEVFNY